jgi:hypothetical protein
MRKNTNGSGQMKRYRQAIGNKMNSALNVLKMHMFYYSRMRPDAIWDLSRSSGVC